MLLSDISGNFDTEDEIDTCILTIVSLLDELLERADLGSVPR